MTFYPNDADGDALRRIAADGVDMSRPRLIEFSIDAPTESSSQAIADVLVGNGYQTSIYYDPGEPVDQGGENLEHHGPSWTVCANVTMVPEYDPIIEIQADLDRLARPLGGHSDGWGTLIE